MSWTILLGRSTAVTQLHERCRNEKGIPNTGRDLKAAKWYDTHGVSPQILRLCTKTSRVRPEVGRARRRRRAVHDRGARDLDGDTMRPATTFPRGFRSAAVS